MTPNNIAKVNRRLKPNNMKIRCYGSGHALFDISGNAPEFMDFLSVADMSISTVEELAAICRLKDTREVAQEEQTSKPARHDKSMPRKEALAKKKGVAKEKAPCDVRGVEIGLGDLVAYGDCSGSTLYCHYVVRITPVFVWMAGDKDKRCVTGNARREHKRVAVVEKAK